MTEELYTQMSQAVIDGDEEAAEALAQQALDGGIDPLEAINRGFTPGMDTVGDLYSRGEYFLPDLILGGEAMKAALAVLEPALKAKGQERHVLGTIVLGTVKGDIHEIGKSLVGSMLSANGFLVHDV
ncbi:MAG: B12-binding domain-containing protein, partial [Anaerolineae bacterium]|nr:B12-binding domain-containing protein [Anaerolineae bacterium]